MESQISDNSAYPKDVDVDTYAGKLHIEWAPDATLGYNPHKPGRPSLSYHSYLIANLRPVLDAEVQAGNQSHCNDSLPGLVTLLYRLPIDRKPVFIQIEKNPVIVIGE